MRSALTCTLRSFQKILQRSPKILAGLPAKFANLLRSSRPLVLAEFLVPGPQLQIILHDPSVHVALYDAVPRHTNSVSEGEIRGRRAPKSELTTLHKERCCVGGLPDIRPR